MDPFEVRMQFLTLLRRLNATQQSIQKIVSYALKYFTRCGDDLWECVVEECQKGTLNMRINILYLLDNLCEASLVHQNQPNTTTLKGPSGSYMQYVSRDLNKIVQLVVPDTRDGLVNLMSARQILDSWRSKRILDPAVVDDVIHTLQDRRQSLHLAASTSASASHDSNNGNGSARPHPAKTTEFSKDEVVKRIEEDRERHKLLRQKRWHVPVPAQSLQQSSTTQHSRSYSLSSTLQPPTSPTQPEQTISHETALDIEFENAWETTSDWNEDDDDAALEENDLCFSVAGGSQNGVSGQSMNVIEGGERTERMDLS